MCENYTFTLGDENRFLVQLRISGFNHWNFDAVLTCPKDEVKN
jgi:hypothetical protein